MLCLPQARIKRPILVLIWTDPHRSCLWPGPPSSWQLVATGDFNGDSSPDYVLSNINTRQTVIGYLNNNVVIDAAFGPTLPSGWNLIGVADFNGDGHPDYALFISSTGQTVIGYLSGPAVIGVAVGPTVPSGWALLATADFNGDGHPDYLLYNTSSRQTAIWYLNDNVFVSATTDRLFRRAGAWPHRDASRMIVSH